MLTVVMLAVLAGTPVVKVAAPAVKAVNLDQKTADFYFDYFAQQLATHEGIGVTTPSEIDAVIGLDRQKQLLGCAETSCTAELAGALGVDAMVIGGIAKVGAGFVVNVKLIDARDASPLAVFSQRVTDESALLDFLAATASQAANKLLALKGISPKTPVAEVTPPPPPPPAKSPAPPPVRAQAAPAPMPRAGSAWIPAAGVTGALGIGAAVSFALATGDAAALRAQDAAPATYAAAAGQRYSGEAKQGAAAGLAGAAVIAGATTAALYVVPSSSPLHRWLPAIGGAAALASAGVLYALASSDARRIAAGTGINSRVQLEDLRGAGEAKQSAAFALGAAGVAGLAGTALLMLFPPPAHGGALSFVPARGGAITSISWELP